MGKSLRTLPNLNCLIALDAAARLGSFRAAADEMHLTQGAVAQQIRSLEAELECALFVRHARGLKPTEAGAVYVQRLRLALGIIEDATTSLLAHSAHGDPFQVVLGTTVAFASRWLIPRLPRLAEIHPHLSVMIEASDLVRPLQGQGGLAMAIRWGVPPFAGAHTEFLFSGQAIPVCSPDLLAKGQLLTPGDLAAFPLISDSHHNWQRWFEIYGSIAMKLPGHTFSQTSLALEAAEQCMGIALVPRILAQTSLVSGALIEAMSIQYRLETGAGFYALTPTTPPDGSPLDDLIKWLLSEAAHT